MPLYDVYLVSGEGSRGSRAYSFTARNDLEAEKFVVARLTDEPVELWCFARRVSRFEGKRLRRLF
jgi:hypothetical protein